MDNNMEIEHNIHASSSIASIENYVLALIDSHLFLEEELSISKLLNCLQSIFNELRFNGTAKLWSLLNTVFKNKDNKKENNFIFKKNICNIMILFLQNICIDYVPEKYEKQILKNLQQTIDFVSKKCKKELKKNSDISFKYLSLLRCCLELVLSLPINSTILQICFSELKVTKDYNDFSFIFPLFKSKNILDTAKCDYMFKLEWISLLFSKLKFMLKCDTFDSNMGKELCDICFEDLQNEIKNNSFTTAYWKILCTNLYLVYECKNLIDITPYLNLFSYKLVSGLILESSIEYKDAQHFILNWNKSGFSQMSILHASIVQEIVSRTNNIFRNKRAKKRKLNNSLLNDQNLKAINLHTDLLKISFNEMLKSKIHIFDFDEKLFSQLLKITTNLIILPLEDSLKISLVLNFMMQINYVNSNLVINILQLVKLVTEEMQLCYCLIGIINVSSFLDWINLCQQRFEIKDGINSENCITLRNKIIFASLKMNDELINLEIYFEKIKISVTNKILEINNIVSLEEMIQIMEQILKGVNRHYMKDIIKQKLLAHLFDYAKLYLSYLKNYLTISMNDDTDNTSSSIDNYESLICTKGFVYSIQSFSTNVNNAKSHLTELLTYSSKIIQISLKKLHDSKIENTNDLKNNIFLITYIIQNYSSFKSLLAKDFLTNLWTLILDKIIYLLQNTDSKDVSKYFSYSNLSRSVTKNDGHNCVLISKLCQAASLILFSLESIDFQANLHNILQPFQTDYNNDNMKILSSILIWNNIMNFFPCSDEIILKHLIHYSQKILVSYLILMKECTSSMLSLQILFSVSRYSFLDRNFFNLQEMSLSFQLFSSVNLEEKLSSHTKWPFEDAISFMHLHHDFLNQLLLAHPEDTLIQISSFVGHVCILLRCSVIIGDQRISRSFEEMEKIVNISLLLFRLASLMSNYKKDFSKVVPFLIGEYVNMLQTTTLYPVVKRNLEPSIHKWLDIMSTFSISHLHVALSPGARQIFKNIYTEFTKYYKYNKRN